MQAQHYPFNWPAQVLCIEWNKLEVVARSSLHQGVCASGKANPTIGEMPAIEKGTSPSGGTRQGTLASTVSGMVSIEQAKFEQLLSDFEHNSRDLNASEMSKMLRSLFLNQWGVVLLDATRPLVLCYQHCGLCYSVVHLLFDVWSRCGSMCFVPFELC